MSRKRCRIEGPRPVADLNHRASASSRRTTEGPVEHSADELLGVVARGPHDPFRLLLGHEFAVSVVVAAVHAPQSKIVRECLVVVVGDPEVLRAVWAFVAEESVVVNWDTDAEPLNRWTRPSRCSKSAGLAGTFQWTMSGYHRWKSIPCGPIDVDAGTVGKNGGLNAACTSDVRSTEFSSVFALPLANP